MKKTLKVYGWIESAGSPQSRRIATRHAPHHSQVRMIAAATSGAAAARLVGETPRRLWNFGDTENAVELEVALAEPGIVFIAPLDHHYEASDYERLEIEKERAR